MNPIALPTKCLQSSKKEDSLTKCTISGPLYLVLLILRIVGLAPLSFKRQHKSWHISVSKFYNKYSQIVLLYMLFSGIIIIIAEMFQFSPNCIIRPMVWVVDTALEIFVITLSAYMNKNRMHCMISAFAKMAQVNAESERHLPLIKSSEKKKYFMVICSLITITSTMFSIMLGVNKYLKEFIIKHGSLAVFMVSSYITTTITYTEVSILTLQFSLTSLEILKTFQIMNNCVRSLLEEIYKKSGTTFAMSPIPIAVNKLLKDNVKNGRMTQLNAYKSVTYNSRIAIIEPRTISVKRSAATTSEKLHHLALQYCTLCDIVRQVNDSNELLLMLILVSCGLHMISVPYEILINIIKGDPARITNIMQEIILASINFSTLLMITEPCHKTVEQMKLTRNLVNQIKRFTAQQNDLALIAEVKLFDQLLTLNEVTYKPMQFIIINRFLVITVLGTATTYVTILIGADIKK